MTLQFSTGFACVQAETVVVMQINEENVYISQTGEST
jgi:hypothetical protein